MVWRVAWPLVARTLAMAPAEVALKKAKRRFAKANRDLRKANLAGRRRSRLAAGARPQRSALPAGGTTRSTTTGRWSDPTWRSTRRPVMPTEQDASR